MIAELRELWRFRELLIILVQRDLKVRYKNSVLGFGWSLVNPLVQVLIIALVMRFFLKVQVPNYHMYLFCALLPWLFFQGTLMDSSISIIESDRLLRRVYFPREILPLARIIANLMHFAAATGVFLIYVALNSGFWWVTTNSFDWALQGTAVLLPALMFIELMLVIGLGLILSVVTLYFEDARHILDNLLKMFYWLLPVLYFADILRGQKGLGIPPEWVYRLYMLNPLAAVITAFRKLTLPAFETEGGTYMTPMAGDDWALLGIAAVSSLVIALLGYAFFNQRKWKLAERP